MNSNLEQNVVSTSNGLQEAITVKYSESIKSLFIFLHLLIPILSVESLFSWCIGIWGTYKIISIYRDEKRNKIEKSIKFLILSWTVATVYNILVYYVTKIVVAKIV